MIDGVRSTEDEPVRQGVMAMSTDERPACCHAAVTRQTNIDLTVTLHVTTRLHDAVTQRPLYQQRLHQFRQLRQLEDRHYLRSEYCPSIRHITRSRKDVKSLNTVLHACAVSQLRRLADIASTLLYTDNEGRTALS